MQHIQISPLTYTTSSYIHTINLNINRITLIYPYNLNTKPFTSTKIHNSNFFQGKPIKLHHKNELSTQNYQTLAKKLQTKSTIFRIIKITITLNYNNIIQIPLICYFTIHMKFKNPKKQKMKLKNKKA
jgi:hypothetical protein